MQSTFAHKLSLLNQTTLDSLNISKASLVIKNFTINGLKIIGADHAIAWAREDNSQKYSLAFASKNLPFEPVPPRNKGLRNKVENRQKLLFGQVSSKTIAFRKGLLPYVKNFVIIPVSYRNEIYGNIVFYFKRKKVFSKEEASLCSALGHSAAQAITINQLNNRLKLSNKNLEKKVKERTKLLIEDSAKDQALLESIGDGILAIDKQGTIITMNAQASAVLGTKTGELVGKSLFSEVPLFNHQGEQIKTENRPSYKALTNTHSLATTKTSSYYYRNKSGELVPVALTITPFRLNGEVFGAIEVMRDITQEREMERVKSELISLVSHQLRTPLSAINWYSEALLKDELGKTTAEQKKYLKEISIANQKMVELVYDFLNVSRVELGTFSLKLSRLNVVEISQSILKEMHPLIHNKKIKILEHYDRGLEDLQADRKIIRLILQNLITNAVKYTPPEGRVEITIGLEPMGRKGLGLSLSVSDNGYGIPKTQQDKIFTKLFRADNAAKLDTEGTGLGLYLVKSFVDFCKGKIWFKSTLNKGSSFYVQLPLEEFSLAKTT